MKKLLGIVVLGLLLSASLVKGATIEYVEETYIKCTPNENRSNKSYFSTDTIKKLNYIKLSPPTRVFFSWSDTDQKFFGKSSMVVYETTYDIAEKPIFGIKKTINISRETGFLWMGSGYGKGDPEDMICEKINESDLPFKKVKKLF